MALAAPTVDFTELSALVQQNQARAQGYMGAAQAGLEENDRANQIRRQQQIASFGAPGQPGQFQSQGPGGGGYAERLGRLQNSTAPAATMPSGERAAYIRNGLIQRGMPEHVADGFLYNFKDESGLDPNINEANPIVPGSRGGFGLYQLTGDRRQAYESWAQTNGLPLGEIDPQLDWLTHELQTTENKAAQRIFASRNAGEAGAAIVEHFLRPSPEHMTRRRNSYLGIQAPSAPAARPVPQLTDPHFAAMASFGQPVG